MPNRPIRMSARLFILLFKAIKCITTIRACDINRADSFGNFFPKVYASREALLFYLQNSVIFGKINYYNMPEIGDYQSEIINIHRVSGVSFVTMDHHTKSQNSSINTCL